MSKNLYNLNGITVSEKTIRVILEDYESFLFVVKPRVSTSDEKINMYLDSFNDS